MPKSKNRRNHKLKVKQRYLTKINERNKLFNEFKKEQDLLAEKRKKDLEMAKQINTEEE
ncbi:MAG: hypothetical protein J5I47_07780 [Vicingus serpentipes]|nr:hypothetical protein [Vicingus serpentipes]